MGGEYRKGQCGKEHGTGDSMRVVNLKCNGETFPNQVTGEKLFFNWNLEEDSCGAHQTAYEILVKEKDTVLWNSGRVESMDCLYIPYTGAALKASTEYIWQVRVWDNKGKATDFAEGRFETGTDRWTAEWIGYDKPVDGKVFDPTIPFYCADEFDQGKNQLFLPPPPYLRKEFEVQKSVERAKLYVSAFGLVDVQINGREVSDNRFIPGLSNYAETVYSMAFDVGEFIQTGANTLSVVLADGWYAGYIGLSNREWYGSTPRAMIQLELWDEDGRQKVVSDASWKAAYGGLREADIFQGEKLDALKEPTGWRENGFDDSGWEFVETGAEYEIWPTPHPGVPIVIHEQVLPAKMMLLKPNVYRVCFDKYICGVLRITVKGEQGSSIVIRHAEILDEEGALLLDGNRSARAQDEYILQGCGEEEFSPIFTYHGFRYADIQLTGQVELVEVQGLPISSALLEPTQFTCDNEVINHVFEMVQATERANLFDTPTDCCARDERLGWGLEGNHFLFAMTYMNDQYRMIRKWAKDIWDGQRENGALEAIAPTMIMKDVEPFVGDLQSNHGVYMVYALYKMYGDLQTAKEYYPKMEKFFEFLDRSSDRNIRYATSCDWVGIFESTEHSDVNHGYGECSPIVIGTAHYALTAYMMYEISVGLGETEKAEKYKALHESILYSFRRLFIERDGTLRYKTQGDYLMALACGGFPEEHREKAFQYLEKKLTKDGYVRWFGGTPTTPYLLKVLKEYGRDDLVNQFLSSKRYPSIGYMYKKGFDTIWERWDGLWEDGSLHPQPMNAFCHIGYSVVGAHIVSGLAGIDTISGGFRRIWICPGPTKEVTKCHAAYHSTYGVIETAWEWKENEFRIAVKIPAGTTAKVTLPCTGKSSLTGLPEETEQVEYEKNKVSFEIASGRYSFQTHAELFTDH